MRLLYQCVLSKLYYMCIISLSAYLSKIVLALRMDSNCPPVDATGNSLGHHRYLINLTKPLQILHGLVTCVLCFAVITAVVICLNPSDCKVSACPPFQMHKGINSSHKLFKSGIDACFYLKL